MKRKTNTTVGMLRKGDRFTLLGDNNVVLEVTGFSRDKVLYNKKHGEKHAWLFDREFPSGKEVTFLRHTILQEGDECFLQELPNGSLVSIPNKEGKYIIKDRFEDEIKLKTQFGHKLIFTHPLTSVTLEELPVK